MAFDTWSDKVGWHDNKKNKKIIVHAARVALSSINDKKARDPGLFN